jgi:hypothetical protein
MCVAAYKVLYALFVFPLLFAIMKSTNNEYRANKRIVNIDISIRTFAVNSLFDDSPCFLSSKNHLNQPETPSLLI